MTTDANWEPTLVKNDLERWFTAAYALWSEAVGGDWKLLGGYPKDRNTVYMLQKMLERDWGITGRENGLQEVRLLIKDEYHKRPDVDAWDYCRAMQLLGLFYVVGYINREEMTSFSCTVGTVMQRCYHSWDEACRAYLRGYEQWCRRECGDRRQEADKLVAARQGLYARFCGMAGGPYRISWNMRLEPAPEKENAGCYYRQWLEKEEAWMGEYRRRTLKKQMAVTAPIVIVLLALFTGAVSAVSGPSGSSNFIAMAGYGALAGCFVMGIFLLILSIALHQNRLSQAVEAAAKELKMDEREKDRLGSEMLAALEDKRHALFYKINGPNAQNTPAQLLVSENYLFSGGSYPLAILIRRSDVQYMEIGQETKMVTERRGNTARTRPHDVCMIYFYFRSSAERRLEGKTAADAGIGFFDERIRDQAFAMMGGRKQPF